MGEFVPMWGFPGIFRQDCRIGRIYRKLGGFGSLAGGGALMRARLERWRGVFTGLTR